MSCDSDTALHQLNTFWVRPRPASMTFKKGGHIYSSYFASPVGFKHVQTIPRCPSRPLSCSTLAQVAEIEKQLEAKEVLLLQRQLEKLGRGSDWIADGKRLGCQGCQVIR